MPCRVGRARAGDPKVVIIVGATHGATAGYRADADRAYAEAIKYTSNVVKVYSPNATWAKVKAAAVGASIVIYLGHGNGWPSPYTYDPNYTTKDGFGLNATSRRRRLQQQVLRRAVRSPTLELAPDAIVLLHHLCYASGNSEPGNPEPSVSVARQRADNYAAGFLKAGAAAVIADGHAGAESLHPGAVHDPPVDRGHVAHRAERERPRRQLRVGPDAGRHRLPGSRTRRPRGFYRSLASARSGVTTDEVVSAGYGDTSVDPASLVVPGNAAVGDRRRRACTATRTRRRRRPRRCRPGRGCASSTQPTGTTAEGAPLVEVAGHRRPGDRRLHGRRRPAPRDSTRAGRPESLDVGAGRSRPTATARATTRSSTRRFTESVAWTGPRARRRRSTSCSNRPARAPRSRPTGTAWSAAIPSPTGTYTVEVSGDDAWDNGPASGQRAPSSSTPCAPQLTGLTPDAATTQWFSPNGDGSATRSA